MHALMNWLLTAPDNINEIQLFFPVRGHSFLPADRVFGRMEKDLKKEDTIVTQNKYLDIYRQHGIVKDWTIKNIKLLEEKYKKIVTYKRSKDCQ